jgi:hypothetical protein
MTPVLKGDEIKSIITAVIAGVAVLGGLAAAYLLVKDGIISGDAGIGIIGSVVASGLAYLFTQRSGDQVQKAYAAGVNTTPPEK